MKGTEETKLLIWMFKLMVKRLPVTELKKKRECVNLILRHILFFVFIRPTKVKRHVKLWQ